jgi:hypothetical protein
MPEREAVALVNADASEKCDMPLPWLSIDADRLDQDGSEARPFGVAVSLPRVERSRYNAASG